MCHFKIFKTLSSLSLACKRLHDFVEAEGFAVYNFPSIQTPSYWRDAADALTTLLRAWKGKAFGARPIHLEKDVIRIPQRRARPSQGRRLREQTTDYRPVIDCYEETGKSWISKKEVLAWGAGAELSMRVMSMGEDVEEEW